MEQYTEFITESEANFIIDIYENVRDMVLTGQQVTLIGLSLRMQIKPRELYDHLQLIVDIVTSVEDEVLKGKRRGRGN